MMLMACVGLNNVLEPIQEHPQYENIRRLAKKGQEFCKIVNGILEERAELDSYVAKSLSKMSTKLSKAAQTCEGTLSELCSRSAAQLESEAEQHRWISENIQTDICVPCKELWERHCKAKKQAETHVDRQLKAFMDKRSDELKGRKLAFTLARDCEDMREQLRARVDAKGKPLTDKDIKKLEKKIKQTREERDKLDLVYWNECQKVEIARQDWELAIARAVNQMREAEEERMRRMKEYLCIYSQHVSQLGPRLSKSTATLEEAVKVANIDADLRTVQELYKIKCDQFTQPTLPAFYAETLDNRMDPVERRRLLIRYLTYAQSDLSREVKGREGVEKLVTVYRNSPNFGDTDVQQEVNDKLQQVKKMIEYVEASQFKISAALFLLDVSPDSGRTVQIKENTDHEVPGSTARTSDDDGEEGDYRDSFYSFQTEDVSKVEELDLSGISEHSRAITGIATDLNESRSRNIPSILCQCRVLYDFNARRDDELTLTTGEIVKVYCKQTADWWFGEKLSCSGSCGLFPSVYVQELSNHCLGLSSYV